MKAKSSLSLLCSIAVAILVGCSSTDQGAAGSARNGSKRGVSAQGAGSGAGGVENNAQQSGVGTGTTGAGNP
ncbi:MAG: hypothetical protein JWR69_4145 [Pedosphaera sp.]|nr:hypothetical protein [Pedosphaera sp.]